MANLFLGMLDPYSGHIRHRRMRASPPPTYMKYTERYTRTSAATCSGGNDSASTRATLKQRTPCCSYQASRTKSRLHSTS